MFYLALAFSTLLVQNGGSLRTKTHRHLAYLILMCMDFILLFFVVLGVAIRASHLVGRHFITFIKSPALVHGL
jgi:hypothetical protein